MHDALGFTRTVLNLFKAICRLTGNNKNMIKKICDILNIVLYKGEECDNMMADLMKYRESTMKQCDLLLECEGKILRKSMQKCYNAIKKITHFEIISPNALVFGRNQRKHYEKNVKVRLYPRYERPLKVNL